MIVILGIFQLLDLLFLCVVLLSHVSINTVMYIVSDQGPGVTPFLGYF